MSVKIYDYNQLVYENYIHYKKGHNLYAYHYYYVKNIMYTCWLMQQSQCDILFKPVLSAIFIQQILSLKLLISLFFNILAFSALMFG